MKIGEFLKKLREEKGFNFRVAAEKSGLSHSYIRYIEVGKRPGSGTPINPSPDTLKRLAKAYDYDYDELLKMAGYLENAYEQNEHVDEFDPEVRSLAREIQGFDPANRGLLKDIIKSMRERGKKASDE